MNYKVENKIIHIFDLSYQIYLSIGNSVHNWKIQIDVSNVRSFFAFVNNMHAFPRTPLFQSARTDKHLKAIFVSKLFRMNSCKCHGVYLLRAVKRSFFTLSLHNSEQKFN